MPYALLLFIAMPIIEIAVLLRVGSAIGWLPTLGIVILTAVIGSYMLRQQGLLTLNLARQRLASGELPAEQILEGVLLLIGGVLLLTPGFVTDAFGFACLLPPSRRYMARQAAKKTSFIVGASSVRGRSYTDNSQPGPGGFSSRPRPGGDSVPRRGQIIDGDFDTIDDSSDSMKR